MAPLGAERRKAGDSLGILLGTPRTTPAHSSGVDVGEYCGGSVDAGASEPAERRQRGCQRLHVLPAGGDIDRIGCERRRFRHHLQRPERRAAEGGGTLGDQVDILVDAAGDLLEWLIPLAPGPRDVVTVGFGWYRT